MASLLDRMNVSVPGPIRTRNSKESHSPYNRPATKGNVEGTWAHDLYDNSLSARLTDTSGPPSRLARPVLVQKALARALPATAAANSLSIKGASNPQNTRNLNVIQVTGLVNGTTPADLNAIFKRCGEILKSVEIPSRGVDGVTIRVTFKEGASAAAAVAKFHGQPADGKTLSVVLVGAESKGTTLAGRLGGNDGLAVVRAEGSVDALMVDDSNGSSKMRSDSLLGGSDPRAHVLVAPPGANPAEYTQSSRPPPRGPRGNFNNQRRGYGNHRRGKRGGPGARMDTD